MKYIYTFSKNRRVQYVSHLDTLRVFERAMRRAKLPASYSQGFHPHPLITFAQPLGVGISSKSELVEIAFDRPLCVGEQERFSQSMPEGFGILNYCENEKKSPFAALEWAAYEICITTAISQKRLEDFMKQEEILMLKRSKKGEKQVNIRPMIQSLELVPWENATVLKAVLKAGQPSLKPELLLQALEQYIQGSALEVQSVCRTALLDGNGQPVA
ncbi:MAG: DUF2344 domain-containing protein [Clostridia bacterium]|nr:DUF2344 domain-containing protein [Clostridia bacterium]